MLIFIILWMELNVEINPFQSYNQDFSLTMLKVFFCYSLMAKFNFKMIRVRTFVTVEC